MRVAFVSETTAHHVDADDVDRLHLLADLLGERGHDVHVCCAQWWDGRPDTFEHEGLTYHAVTGERGQRGFAAKAAVALQRLGPDVVHATSRTPGTSTARAGAASWPARPSSWTGTNPTTPRTACAAGPIGTPHGNRTPSSRRPAR
ncbi:glycosyltransferase family 4 protein [Halobacterium bonnevillei]|uniref:glycosyltransferase family 4 protein n=1 Tax=Halobacterium bonnevillei TaxID=2692200 RepID=UPI001F1C54FD|nr:glycosyltransferase family 4 protein [Halobacterium bonnevillei]